MSTNSQATTEETPDRETLRTKAFWIAFEMIFVFGIPAAGAVLFSRWLIAEGLLAEWGMYVALGAAFVLSWIIVYLRVQRLSQDLKKADRKAKADKKENA